MPISFEETVQVIFNLVREKEELKRKLDAALLELEAIRKSDAEKGKDN
jgi:hypothetical protein